MELKYKVDGVEMTGNEMYALANRLYGRREFMLTNSKARCVLAWNGHQVEYIWPPAPRETHLFDGSFLFKWWRKRH